MNIDEDLRAAIADVMRAWRDIAIELPGLDEALSALDDMVEGRDYDAWEKDPRRHSAEPRDRAAWVVDDPDPARRAIVGESDGGESFASDGWGCMSWRGEAIDVGSLRKPLEPWQWRKALAGPVGFSVPLERVTLKDGLHAYRIGPAVFDARRVDEWVPDLTIPPRAPLDHRSPALWKGPDWSAMVMPLNEGESPEVTEGWTEEEAA
jgi:hypothetical protein